jgi:hypothetical protein
MLYRPLFATKLEERERERGYVYTVYEVYAMKELYPNPSTHQHQQQIISSSGAGD